MKLFIGLSRAILWLEPLILVVIALAFWYPTPTRTDWLWLLWLLIPILIARLAAHGRFITRTPLDLVFIAFLVLGVINVLFAPYTRGLMMLARPLMGIVIYYAIVERVRESDDLNGPVQAVVLTSLLIGLQAVGATQWPVKKAVPLQGFFDVMPIIQLPISTGGFNPNEIAGAMTWLLPLMGGIAIYRWQKRGIRWDVTLAFCLLLVAMLLGQSRSSIAGIVVAFSLITHLLLRRGWRLLGWLCIISIIALEVSIFASEFTTPSTLPPSSAGTEASATNPPQLITPMDSNLRGRMEIWNSGLAILRDHPFVGVGLSMFRDGRVRSAYPVAALEGRILPHAHNEMLQISTDMGISGLIVFLVLHGIVCWMLIRVWRVGGAETRAIGLAVGAGLLAHFIFGLTDAITLWDRFAFVFWLMLGLAGGVYTKVTRAASISQNDAGMESRKPINHDSEK